MVLGVLAIVWVVVLGSYAKERMADRRTDSVSAFHSQLSTLQRTHAGRRPAAQRAGVAPSRTLSAASMACAVARQRRKNVLIGLLTTALLTVMVAVAAPGFVTIAVAVLAVAAFSGYVLLLVERQRVITEQRTKVRSIHARPQTFNRPVPARRPVLSASSSSR